MRYNSTRNSSLSVSSAEAIAKGISADGGLFVPEALPMFTEDEFAAMQEMDYIGRAKMVLSRFLTDYTEAELEACVKSAYLGSFDEDRPAPLTRYTGEADILELWHGPTCAFKDLALQILPHLLTTAVSKTAGEQETVILVATSGDTGKAALEGFRDVQGTRILVFYPEDGVSPMQKLQMTTQEGENVFVTAIRGNFDDAQTGVKKIFTDSKTAAELKKNGMAFSSANSINWGRLVPQIVYYVSAYCDLRAAGKDLFWGFNVVVPTGNFGNILAAFYAKCMGVPVAKLICASNQNNVLTEFLTTGHYSRNRDFYTTISPSMDILISSNLERLLYHLSGRDDAKIAGYMAELSKTGEYTVDAALLSAIHDNFCADFLNDEETKAVIARVFAEKGYLCDTHTAVAVGVYDRYVEKTGDRKPAVIASTASPFKFSRAVLSAIAPDAASGEEAELVGRLSERTGWPVPGPLASLAGKPVRFAGSCTAGTMKRTILSALGISAAKAKDVKAPAKAPAEKAKGAKAPAKAPAEKAKDVKAPAKAPAEKAKAPAKPAATGSAKKSK